MSILLITEENNEISKVKDELAEGYPVTIANNLESTMGCILSRDINIVFLDYTVALLNDLEIIKLIQNMINRPEVIILTSTRKEKIKEDLVLKIAKGFIERPYPISEFKKCIYDISRSESQVFDLIKIDTRMMKAKYQEESIPLTETEMKILMLFISSPGRVYSKKEIQKIIWNGDIKTRHNLGTHMSNLKRKLPILKDILKNSRGRGYFLEIK